MNNQVNGVSVGADTPLGAIIASADDMEPIIYINLRRPEFDEDLELAIIEFWSTNTGLPDEKLYMTAHIYCDAADDKTIDTERVILRDIEECFCTGCCVRLERLFNSVVIKAGDDPKHPGIYIDLHHPNDDYDIPLVLVEFSADDADNPSGEPRIASYICGDSAIEDYTNRVVHQNIEEYFRTEDVSEHQSDGCRREYIDEPLVLNRENFDSCEWTAYCKLAGGLPPERTQRIVFHVNRIDSCVIPQI